MTADPLPGSALALLADPDDLESLLSLRHLRAQLGDLGEQIASHTAGEPPRCALVVGTPAYARDRADGRVPTVYVHPGPLPAGCATPSGAAQTCIPSPAWAGGAVVAYPRPRGRQVSVGSIAPVSRARSRVGGTGEAVLLLGGFGRLPQPTAALRQLRPSLRAAADEMRARGVTGAVVFTDAPERLRSAVLALLPAGTRFADSFDLLESQVRAAGVVCATPGLAAVAHARAASRPLLVLGAVTGSQELVRAGLAAHGATAVRPAGGADREGDPALLLGDGALWDRFASSDPMNGAAQIARQVRQLYYAPA